MPASGAARQKVVVLSNYATPDMRKRCAQLGADAVFDKSNEIDALVDYCVALPAQAGAPASRAVTPGARAQSISLFFSA